MAPSSLHWGNLKGTSISGSMKNRDFQEYPSNQGNLKMPDLHFCVLRQNILKTELFEIDDVTVTA